jgi:hypothetical protein
LTKKTNSKISSGGFLPRNNYRRRFTNDYSSIFSIQLLTNQNACLKHISYITIHMMDENYEDDEEQNPIEENLPAFEYESKDDLELSKLVHSILVESSKSKGLIPNTLTKRICETVGVESNDEVFFNLLGMLAEFSLNSMATEVKNVLKVNKGKKDKVLETSEVRKTLEDKGIYLCASKIIPEMGVSETKQSAYEMSE